MSDIEVKIKENIKRNEKFIKEFSEWLEEKGLTNKTINKHINNIDLYINHYLNYYDITKMEDGICSVYSFLSGWFIEKCLWASQTSIKETSASIKKFYNCMCDKGYVSKEDYKSLCDVIKDNMDEFLYQLEAYDNGEFYDF